MRKLILIAVFLLSACTGQPQVASVPSIPSVTLDVGDTLAVNCPGIAVVVDGLLSCNAIPSTHTPVATPTDAPSPTVIEAPTATKTNTAIVTPTPTETAVATPTRSAPVVLVPYAAAPLCATHDDRFWHGLWDSARGCHYDHEHGVDPNHAIVATFQITGTDFVMGDMRSLQGGVDFGYGWQTTLENYNKHRGYKGQSAIDLPCEQQNYSYIPAANRKCIAAFDIVMHYDHGTREGTGRFHSFSAHIVGCERDGLNCGDIFTGGISDTGDLHSPYKTTCQDAIGSNRPLCPDAQTWETQRHNPPYWAYSTREEAFRAFNGGYLDRNDPANLSLPSNKMIWDNYSSDRTPSIGNRLGQANKLVHINARNYNSSAFYDTQTRTFEYLCPESDCLATNDALYVYAVAFEVPVNLPKDSQGYVNYTGWTNRAGKVVTNCTEIGVECVPLRIRHLKPGLYIYDMTEGFIPAGRSWGDGVYTNGVRYFDPTPRGVKCATQPSRDCSWIKLPTQLGQ